MKISTIVIPNSMKLRFDGLSVLLSQSEPISHETLKIPHAAPHSQNNAKKHGSTGCPWEKIQHWR